MTPPVDAAVAAIEDMLGQRAGLRLNEERRLALARLVERRPLALRLADASAYAAMLAGSADSAEWQWLLNEMTIGETYFFRTRDFAKAFCGTILPETWPRDGNSTRPLRVWSAACATGEEPYSVAIWLLNSGRLQVGAPAHILATDVDTGALARAHEGSYASWSFRGVAPDDPRIANYFSAKGNRWLISDAVRDLVRFEHRNLATAPTPVPSQGKWDMIFIRNVLLYFDAATTNRVVDGAVAQLAVGGLLFVGECESVRHDLLEAQLVDGIYYYRRLRHAPQPAESSRRQNMRPIAGPRPMARAVERSPTPQRRPRSPPLTPAQRVARLQDVAAMARTAGNIADLERALVRVVEIDATQTEAALDLAALLVEQARYEEGIAGCEAALQHDDVSARAHTLLGIAWHGRGDSAQAAQRLRQALFLDEHDVLGHYFMAKLREAADDMNGAVREYRLALAAAQRQPEQRLDLGYRTDQLSRILRAWLSAHTRTSGATP